jgi:DNA-binding MarR family transcriptional regulator
VVSDTRWLDEHEQHTWRSFLTAHRLLFDGIERQLQQDSGLPHTYYEILVRLSEAPGRSMRMAELADLAYYSRSRLSHRVRRLEDRHLVRRKTATEDGRGVVATLTDTGFALLERAAPDNLRSVREHFVDVVETADLQAIGRAMRAVTDSLP